MIQVIKRYYADGRRVATRISNTTQTEPLVYYHLVDAQGTMSQVLYDPYGAVLSHTLSMTLTQALGATGDVVEPDTGLVYLGNGRYYDPLLGRPLQPNSSDVTPTVPQSLNRYAATPLGPPGEAEVPGLPLMIRLFLTWGKASSIYLCLKRLSRVLWLIYGLQLIVFLVAPSGVSERFSQ